MTAEALGLAWAAWVVLALWPWRPAPSRVRALRDDAVAPPWRSARRRLRPVAGVGRLVLRLAGWRRSAPAAGAELEQRVGWSVLGAVVAGLAVHPLAAPAAGLAVWVRPVLASRRARARHAAAVRRDLPEVVDLLALAVGAGMNVPLAVAAVARWASGPVAEELSRAVTGSHRGRLLGDALGDLPDRLGEDARPLVATLVASERYGTPAGVGLDRLATELRADRRRRADEAARRVPVKLLFPLVVCILPAFALLTVAPLLAGALSALRP